MEIWIGGFLKGIIDRLCQTSREVIAVNDGLGVGNFRGTVARPECVEAVDAGGQDGSKSNIVPPYGQGCYGRVAELVYLAVRAP